MPKKRHKSNQGFTLIELLAVIAIIGIILGVGAISGRSALKGSQERAAVSSIQQSIWQGATAASARGRTTSLRHTNNLLSVELDDGTVLREFELEPSVVTSLPQGIILEFLPPGEIEANSYEALFPDQGSEGRTGITVTTSKDSYELSVSLIGEVRILEGEQ